jgi:hypothetical protein
VMEVGMQSPWVSRFFAGLGHQPPFPRPPDRPNGCFRGLPPKANSTPISPPSTPISPPSGPAQRLFQGPPAKSKFNPHFPALRTGPTAVSGASRQKQIPSMPPSGPAQRLFQGPPAKSKFLA